MYEKSVLSNGVRVITEEIPMFSSASLGIWVNVGSRHEDHAINGVTHFVEHMLFKGTEKYSATEIAEVMEGVGGYMNGATDKEQTCFSAKVMDQHVPMAFDLLTDMLLNSTFDPEELEREKGVILDEIKTYEDSPSDVIQDLFMRTLWNGHSLGRPVIGREEVIRGMGRERMLDYMKRHYHAGNLIVTAAGHISHQEIAAQVEATLGKLPALPPTPPTEPPHMQLGNIFKVKDVEQIYVCMGPGVSMQDPRKYPLQLLDAVLGGGMSSRLFQEVREKRGLVYNVGSFLMSYMDSGVFGDYVVTNPENLVEVMRLMRQITEDVRKNGITPKEWARAREYLKGSFSLGLESTSLRMTRLMRSEMTEGRWVPPEEVIARYEAVTHEEVNRLAGQLLDANQFATVILGPLTAEHEKTIQELMPGVWHHDEDYSASPVRATVERLAR